MASTVSALSDALKETWTQDQLEKQIFDGDDFLKKLERKAPSQIIGEYALTPIQTSEVGGYTAVGPGGSSSLNPASDAGLAQAQWDWFGHWMQVEVDHMVIKQSKGKARSVIEAAELDIDSATTALRRQLTRQSFQNGDALIAQCGTTSTSDEVELNTGGDGFHAIRMGWLYPGLTVDIGTTASEDDIAGDRLIEAVEEDSATPSITISGADVSTDSSDYVSIANNRSGTTSYESNGLRNVIDSGTTLGTIAPATEPSWAAIEDSTTTVLTLEGLYDKERNILQKGGKPDWIVTSLLQRQKIYTQLQQQVRFGGDGGLSAGNMDNLKIGNITLDPHADCPDSDLYILSSKHLFSLREAPEWASQEFGGSILQWNQGSTKVVGGLVAYHELGVNRRNVHAKFSALT